jgi:hypothetical protein
MNPVRRVWRLAAVLAAGVLLTLGARAQAQVDPLPSWNDGPARNAILEFVRVTTDPASPAFVKPEARLATFDQNGTLWVEHPAYSQLVFAFDRVVELAPSNPEWKTKMPFAAVVRGDRAAMTRPSRRGSSGRATGGGSGPTPTSSISPCWR